MNPAPADCLYCGSPDWWVWEPGPTMKAIACSNGLCASTGPVRATVADAVAAWNKPPRPTTGDAAHEPAPAVP